MDIHEQHCSICRIAMLLAVEVVLWCYLLPLAAPCTMDVIQCLQGQMMTPSPEQEQPDANQVQGNQTNIPGTVHGPVASGTFHAPANIGDGQQANIENQGSNYGAQGIFNNSPITIQQAVRPATVAFQVPHRELGDAFVGRQDALEQLWQLLMQRGSAGVAPAITGMGGIGKTQLASEFAHRYRDQFPGGVFWLNMADPTGVASQVAACAGPGGLHLPAYTGLDIDGQIAATMAAWREPMVRLVVFDNLEDPTLLDTWRPTGGGCRVLITSRDATWFGHSGVETVALTPLATHPALELLLAGRARRTRSDIATLLVNLADQHTATAIVRELGGLPLALTLAGAYLEQQWMTPLGRYHEQLTQEAIQHRSLNAELRNALPTGHTASIVATFALSKQQLDPSRPADTLALCMWERAAQLAPEPIPLRLLIRTAELDPDAAADQEQAVLGLERLQAVGVVEVTSEAATLHRLLAAYARSIAAHPEQDHTQVVAAAITECYAINQAGYSLHGLIYLGQLRFLADYHGETQQHATLLINLGYLLQAQGDLVGARPYYERALAINEQRLGVNHPNTTIVRENYQALLRDLANQSV
jgi:tetratricopeptide (TPR) repeat protein